MDLVQFLDVTKSENFDFAKNIIRYNRKGINGKDNPLDEAYCDGRSLIQIFR